MMLTHASCTNARFLILYNLGSSFFEFLSQLEAWTLPILARLRDRSLNRQPPRERDGVGAYCMRLFLCTFTTSVPCTNCTFTQFLPQLTLSIVLHMKGGPVFSRFAAIRRAILRSRSAFKAFELDSQGAPSVVIPWRGEPSAVSRQPRGLYPAKATSYQTPTPLVRLELGSTGHRS